MWRKTKHTFGEKVNKTINEVHSFFSIFQQLCQYNIVQFQQLFSLVCLREREERSGTLRDKTGSQHALFDLIEIISRARAITNKLISQGAVMHKNKVVFSFIKVKCAISLPLAAPNRTSQVSNKQTLYVLFGGFMVNKLHTLSSKTIEND